MKKTYLQPQFETIKTVATSVMQAASLDNNSGGVQFGGGAPGRSAFVPD